MPEAEVSDRPTVFSFPGVAFDHLVSGLETREGHISDRILFVMCFGSRDDGGEGGERKVDTRERHQVGLELVQVDVEGTPEPERGCDRGHDLGDQPIQVRETGLGNV